MTAETIAQLAGGIVAAVVLPVVGVLYGKYMERAKQRSDMGITERKADDDLTATRETRTVTQVWAYADRLAAECVATRKLVDDCRRECDEREAELEQRHAADNAATRERVAVLESRSGEKSEALARLMGWLDSQRMNLKKKGFELPYWYDPGSGTHPALPPEEPHHD